MSLVGDHSRKYLGTGPTGSLADCLSSRGGFVDLQAACTLAS